METEIYDDLEWEVDDTPVGSCTPDEFFELSFQASTECPNCGGTITGLAQYWSTDDSFNSCWFERVDYDPCECTDQEEFDEEEDDELMEDYFKSIS